MRHEFKILFDLSDDSEENKESNDNLELVIESFLTGFLSSITFGAFNNLDCRFTAVSIPNGILITDKFYKESENTVKEGYSYTKAEANHDKKKPMDLSKM